MASSEAQGQAIFDEEANDNKGEFDFDLDWDDFDKIQLRTACCCCVMGFDDCTDIMQVQCEDTCLCLSVKQGCKCFQCTDESGEALACCQGTSQGKMCSMTDPEKTCVLCSSGGKGASLCCMVGTQLMQMCDPCGAPETCLKGMSQLFCCHHRMALPCDEDVQFEIACCGITCAGGPESTHE